MSEGNKISNLRTRKRLEQQTIETVKGKSDATVKPMNPAGKYNGNGK